MRQRTSLNPLIAVVSIRVNRPPALASSTLVSERSISPLREGGRDLSRVPVRNDPPIRIQAKLMVGQTDDPLEHEADRIADQVMRIPEPRARPGSRPGPANKDVAPSPSIQPKSLGTSDSVGFEAPPIVHDALRSPGQPLDAATRAFFEPRFGRDFSQVRVHTDGTAAQSASAVRAKAFTTGSHLAFRTGEYLPGTAAGDRLLAHELTHVVQQSGGDQAAFSPISSAPAGLARQADHDAEDVEDDDKNDPKGTDPTKKSHGNAAKVQIVSGSKPKKGEEGEGKIFGGKLGGHVVIDLGADGVLGFSNDEYGGHFFSKRRRKRNSKFERYTSEEWQKAIQGKQVVTFSLDITEEQRKTIGEAFKGEPNVDYSVLGYRCASYALHALKEAGIVDEPNFKIKYFLAVTPGSLVRFLKKKGFLPEVQEGSKKRKWNRRFGSANQQE
jgi:hypothetical protein